MPQDKASVLWSVLSSGAKGKESGVLPAVPAERSFTSVLARSSSGFRNLCRFLSDHLVAHEPLPPVPPQLDDTVFVFPLPAEDTSTELPPNGYWGVRPEEVRNLQRRPEARYPERMLVWQPVTFADKAGFNTHRLLRAVDHNTLLSKLSPEAQAKPNERLAAFGRTAGTLPRLAAPGGQYPAAVGVLFF